LKVVVLYGLETSESETDAKEKESEKLRSRRIM
jgi:hypothetical protein